MLLWQTISLMVNKLCIKCSCRIYIKYIHMYVWVCRRININVCRYQDVVQVLVSARWCCWCRAHHHCCEGSGERWLRVLRACLPQVGLLHTHDSSRRLKKNVVDNIIDDDLLWNTNGIWEGLWIFKYYYKVPYQISEISSEWRIF